MTLASSYEAKLKRFQEVQARRKARAEKKAAEQERREQKKLMSKSHRREVAKKLKEAIDAATDPQVIAKLSNELSKYLPKPKQIKRKPSKLVIEPKKSPSVMTTLPESFLPHHVEGERVTQFVVLKIEAACRSRGGFSKLSRKEKDYELELAKSTLSPTELKTLEEYAAGLSPEVA